MQHVKHSFFLMKSDQIGIRSVVFSTYNLSNEKWMNLLKRKEGTLRKHFVKWKTR